MNEWTTDPEEILETFAAEIRANMRQYSIWPGHYAVIVSRQLRTHLAVAGLTRADVCRRLCERARIRRREWADVGKGRVVRDRGDTEYRALSDPEHVLLVAAGGPAGGSAAAGALRRHRGLLLRRRSQTARPCGRAASAPVSSSSALSAFSGTCRTESR